MTGVQTCALPILPRTPNVQYADLCFGTPSGRAELYLEELADMGEALPVYVEDHEAQRSHPIAAEFPLVLVQAHVRQRAHSTFFNTGWTLEVWPEQTLEMNPDDAAARGLASGDLGEAHNRRGHMVARVVCNPDLPPGMCNLGEGWKRRLRAPFRPGAKLLDNSSSLPSSARANSL